MTRLSTKPSGKQTKNRVLIIQKALTQYRVDFYFGLKQKLAENGIELSLVYGKRRPENYQKKDEVEIDWAIYSPNKFYKLNNFEFIWQSCLPHIKNKDLIVVEQSNRLLLNYLLMFKRNFSHRKLAFWGHGRNRQIKEHDLRNKIKGIFINRCDWWFAYTQNVRQYLIENSFPDKKITVVQNAIDTRSLTRHLVNITDYQKKQLKLQMGIDSIHVGIFCGGIYKEKRIKFLLEACYLIKQKIPDFSLIVIGSGADSAVIEKASQENEWIHYLGPKFGPDRVKYFSISSLFLMPGLVGLGVLDAFALRTPMVTTNYPYHSPEIEYLENEVNGMITKNNLQAYAETVIHLFIDTKKRENLVKECIKASEKYNVENMVENFATGIIDCLNYR